MIVQKKKKPHQSLVIELGQKFSDLERKKQDEYVYFLAPRSLIGNKQTWHFQFYNPYSKEVVILC